MSAANKTSTLPSKTRTNWDGLQAAAGQEIRLKPNDQVTREIAGGETQIQLVSLIAAQCAVVGFEWNGIDLDVTVLNPDGKPVFASDIQVRASGSLPISLFAETSGDYRLKIRPVENLRISGRYAVTLKLLRAAAVEDKERFDGQVRLLKGELDEPQAMNLFRPAPELFPDADNSYYQAYAFRQLARKALVKQPPDLETSGYYYGLAIAKRRNDPPLRLAYFLLDIGDDYQNRSLRPKAIEYFNQALQTFQSIGESTGEASALYKIGFATARIGRFTEALEFYNRALTIHRNQGNLLPEARTLNAIGGAHIVLGNLSAALREFQEASDKFSQLGDSYRAAITLNNTADVYHSLGDFQPAFDKYTEAVSAFKLRLRELSPSEPPIACASLKDICGVLADVINNLGEIHTSLGDPDAALEEIKKALEIREVVQTPDGLGYTFSTMAYAYLLKDNPRLALGYCEKSIAYSETANDRRRVSITLTFKGMAYSALGQPEEALAAYEEALRIQKETGERRAQAITLDKLGIAYAHKSDPSKSRECLNQALQIWTDVGDADGETITRPHIAGGEWSRGNIEAAREQIAKTLQIVESKRIGLTNKTLRTNYFAGRGNVYEMDIDLKMQMSKLRGANEFITKAFESSEHGRARTLLDDLSDAGVSREVATDLKKKADPKFAGLMDSKEQTARLLSGKSQSRITLLSGPHTQNMVVALDEEINALVRQYDELDNQIAGLNPRYASLIRPAPVTANQVQRELLDKDTILLEYSLGEQRSYVWAVMPDSIKGFQLPPRKEIEATAKLFTKSLSERERREGETGDQWQLRTDQAAAEFNKASATLSKMVIEPVASLLGKKRLVIVADGSLQLVSFAALPVPNNSASTGRRLIDEHEIVYEPSASVLALQRTDLAKRKPAPLAVAVLANPVFDKDDPRVKLPVLASNTSAPRVATQQAETRSAPKPTLERDVTRTLEDIGIDRFRALPSSAKEAEKIVEVAPKGQSKKALNFDANRVTAMSSDLSQYRIVHFATHGFLNYQHPELSGIVLSMVDQRGQPQDGYLRLHDIYNLNLPADVVVLSACQTGVGKQIKGEGLIALTRGFMYAGAASVVASLWKVDDHATAELMGEFYKEMFVKGQRPAAALAAAQRTLSRQKRWRSPYYWAGFVLQGEWK